MESSGGGVFNNAQIQISNSSIIYNYAYDSGGGIFNSGNLSIDNSEIAYNMASGGYEPILGGGGIQNFGTAIIQNSLLHENRGLYEGGGINNSGTATAINVTFDGNGSYYGGGIGNSKEFTIANSIVANNGGGDIANNGTLNLIGTNLVEDGSVTGANVINQDPKLGPLQDNGGATPTLALLPGSPAIDVGDNNEVPASLEFDQRGEGFLRIIDANGDGTATVDLGSFEVQTSTDPDDGLSYDPVTPIPEKEIPGTPGDDILVGTIVAEYFKAGAGVDRESGYGGDDVFLMGPGRDFIGGGGGNDTALFDGNIDDYSGLTYDGDLIYIVH